MSKLTEDEKKSLEGTTSLEEYQAAVASIKAAHDNRYPEDWLSVVKKHGGLEDKLKRKWSSDAP